MSPRFVVANALTGRSPLVWAAWAVVYGAGALLAGEYIRTNTGN